MLQLRSFIRQLLVLPLAAALCAGNAQAETVQQAMADTYLGNPTLAGARAQLRTTDEQVAGALAAMRPTLKLRASAGYLQATEWSFLVAALPIMRNEFDYQPRTARLDAALPIFRGGALNAALRVAEAQVAVQQAQLIASEQAILNSVGMACADLIQADASLKLAEEYAGALARARDGVANMTRRQDMTVTDQAQADTRLAQARAQVSLARSQLFNARFAFQTLVGRPADGMPLSVALEIPVRSEEETLHAALAANPTMVAARHAVSAAEAGTDVAIGNWLPSVDLVASYSYAREASAATILEKDKDITGQLTIPIFAGGAHTSQIRQADHLLSQRRFDLEDSEAAVTAAAKQAWLGVVTADGVVAARRRQAEAAKRSLAGVNLQFDRGNRSFLDTLNALQENITVQTNLLAAERGLTQARLQLLVSIGGLTAHGLKLQVPLHDPGEHLRAVSRAWGDIGE